MDKDLLVMESGGTKTDVAAILNGELIWRRALPSLHPRNWTHTDWQAWTPTSLWPEVEVPVELHFFGAGCNAVERKHELTDHLLDLGYAHLSIHSDLEAATLALAPESPKHIAILGTGSVLLVKQPEGWTHLGGLGFEKGDEGGGAHFGRMVLEDLRKKELSSVQLEQLRFNDLDALNPNNIEHCKQVAMAIGMQSEWLDFHQDNLNLFFERTVQPELQSIEKLHFVGSYAHYLLEELKQICEHKGIHLGKVMAKPMDELINYFTGKR